jgi:hypothetical protein
VHQVAYLQELNRDARSTEHKINPHLNNIDIPRVKRNTLNLRLLMSYIYIYIYIYIYGAPILDVSRSPQRRSTVGRTPLDE